MKELREKNEMDLVKHIAEKREELRKLRFGVAGSAMRNVFAGKVLRREIARALTVLTERNATRAAEIA
jgi:ribosomal protein L29